MADFLVTAALSALSAFHYLGVPHPVIFSAVGIGVIGVLNYFGPRRTGTMALIIAVAAVAVLTILALFSIPHLQTAWRNIQPVEGTPWDIWRNFVGVIVALSGIEAIANTTGIMKLNRGSSLQNPIVTKTSTKAIVIVIVEVALYTTFFAFAASAIGNFQISGGEVDAPGYPNVRDSLLHYVAQVFVGDALGPQIGQVFAWTLSIIVGILLLSAVNTAINGLIALQYLMAGDKEFPSYFQKVNRFGVPVVALGLATAVPIFLVLAVKSVAGLATLYAVGFVGAIATNLGATSTNFALDLKWGERVLMWLSFLIMVCVEITLFIDKPDARLYALAVVTAGLILRGLSQEKKEKAFRIPKSVVASIIPQKGPPSPLPSILNPVHSRGKALKAALEKSNKFGYPLHILFIREQSVISEVDFQRSWENDAAASEIMEFAKAKGREDLIHFHYCVSDSTVDIIVAYAMTLQVTELILDVPRKGRLIQLLRGSKIKKLKQLLPEDIYLTTI